MDKEAADSILIRRVLQGETAAYGILVSRYQQYVFTLVLRHIPRREEAEELAQDVFIKAFSALKDFRQESRFSTWLYTIVHHTCISFLRRRPPPTHPGAEDKMERLPDQYHAVDTQPGEQRSRQAMLERAMGMMNAGDAELLTLFYQSEQSLEEIAAITGIAAGTVKVKIHRARARLKDILVTRFPGEVLNLNYA